MTEKECRDCGETKPLDQYRPHSHRNGEQNICRTCENDMRHDRGKGGVKGRQKLATFEANPEAWMQQAACLYPGKDVPGVRASVDRFFTKKGAPPTVAAQVAAAKAICARCPVTAECLAYAEKTHVQFGIFGGLTETDRRKARKQRKHEQGEAA
jgi:hypothetical protein